VTLTSWHAHIEKEHTLKQHGTHIETARQQSGAQPAPHFGEGAIFLKIHSMTSLFLFNHAFSQTVTDKVLFTTFVKMRTFQF